MSRLWAKALLLCVVFTVALLVAILPSAAPVSARDAEQMPTGSLPTVTSTFAGPMVVVMPGNEPQVNLRSGPGPLYERVGVLLVGQRVPAHGMSPKGEWYQVLYPGAPGGYAWVYAFLVELDPINTILPIVEPPPTPTLAQTATIDPTLAARFVITFQPTRLPTYTPPPPLAIPTFVSESTPAITALPMGFVILGLAALGVFLGVIAFSQR